MEKLTSLTLLGNYASLLPLSIEHAEALKIAVQDGALWQSYFANVPSPENMHSVIERRLLLQNEGRILPFTVIHNESQQPVGMTAMYDIDLTLKRLKIGYTWYQQYVQKTPLNTECKLMLLRHAFEDLECVAVEFCTSIFNLPSRRAIERLGAKLDGVLRNHRRLQNGVISDSCIYSIIDTEWPAVKEKLLMKLNPA